MKKILVMMLMSLSLAMTSTQSLAHCQVPCGIYDDHARVERLMEDSETIRKAVMSLSELSGKTDPQSINQAVRWVNNKESHASNIITTMAEYFLAQRVKPNTDAKGQEAYTKKLVEHHAVILAAMKVKQKAHAKAVDELDAALKALAKYYPKHPH